MAWPEIFNGRGGSYNSNNIFRLIVVVVPKTQIRGFMRQWLMWEK